MFKIDTVKTLADALYEKKLITSDQLAAIKFENVNTGKSIENIVKERAYVNADDYAEAFGETYGIEYVNLTPQQVDVNALDLIPLEMLKKYKIVPFAIKDNKISLAMMDPMDLPTIDYVEKKTGFKVVAFIASDKSIDRALEEQKGKELGAEITAALEEISQNTLKIEESGQEITDATIRDAPIARIVGMILETAVKTGSSDVHIEPGEQKSRLRYRVDGVLDEKRTFPKEMHESIVARIKILSKMKIDEKRVPQDGRFKVEVGATTTDLRVSTLPTVNGEKVVIRLLKAEGTIYSYRDLGMRGLTLRRFEEASMKPNGMMLVTGPTGSGKTVTLASALSKLNTVRVNIVSVEDPVEIRVPGVNQVQVNPQAGLTFASGLRAFLRQDPNIIMVGEIRDNETAELAVHASLTGHLVLSTLHTNSAAGAIPRLLDMHVENFLLASTLNVVLAQRLVRRICTNCMSEYDAPEEIINDITKVVQIVAKNTAMMTKDTEIAKVVKDFDPKKLKLKKGHGCVKCGNTGYRGRIGIYEALPVTEKIALMVLENAPSIKIEQMGIEEGMLTLNQDGYLRVVEGATTIEEVMRVTK